MMKALPINRILKSTKFRRGCRAALSGMLAPVLAFTLVVAGRIEVNATTQQQIDQAQHEKEELEAQQQANQNALDDLRTEQGELQVKVNQLNGQLEEIGDNLQTLEQNMIDKQAEIEATRIALDEAIATEEWQ